MQQATDSRYTQIQLEMDALKLQIKEMRLKETDPHSEAAYYRRPIRVRIPEVMDYGVSEMGTQIEFDLPLCAKQIEKLVSDESVAKQLLANIERNRIKWRA